jgi:hypothetical protein
MPLKTAAVGGNVGGNVLSFFIIGWAKERDSNE